jgi:hypothetical protein
MEEMSMHQLANDNARNVSADRLIASCSGDISDD